MNARALLLLLLLTVALALTPRYRREGLILSTVLIVLMGWQLWAPTASNLRTPQASVASTPSQAVALPTEQIQLTSPVLTGDGAPWRLAGVLTNHAKVMVREVKLSIVRRSCSLPDQAFDQCLLVWQGEHTLQIKIPTGTTQSFEASVWSHDSVPKPAGVVRDQIQVVAANGYGQ